MLLFGNKSKVDRRIGATWSSRLVGLFPIDTVNSSKPSTGLSNSSVVIFVVSETMTERRCWRSERGWENRL